MRKTVLLSLFGLFMFFGQVNSQTPTIKYNGKDYFINGANIPWLNFGNDVGVSYANKAFENTFINCKTYGINCVRLWIHCDGRGTPLFDSTGSVTGVPETFYKNFDSILVKAHRYGILVMPCLWSFDMTKNYSSIGPYAGTHADLIQDSNKTISYVNNVVIPMAERYKDDCNLFAWEVINEPEWSMNVSGGGTTAQVVEASEMQRFVGMISKAIHQHSNKMVTVGSAAVKYNSTVKVGNYWCDSAIYRAYPDSLAFLDFYQIHYYDWMYSSANPFFKDKDVNYWKLDKPTLIGELPGKAGIYTLPQFYEKSIKNGFCGLMFWSMYANDGVSVFADFRNETRNFRLANPDIVDYSCDPSFVPAPASLVVNTDTVYLYKNSGSKSYLTIYGRYKWTLPHDEDWFTLSADSSIGVTYITITASQENTSGAPRSATLTLQMDTLSLPITIIQRDYTSAAKTGKQEGIALTPNVSSGNFKISANAPFKLTLVNSLGQIILEKSYPSNTTYINLSHLPAGIYFASICTTKQNYYSKIAIKK